MFCTACRRNVRTRVEIDVHNTACSKSGERSYALASVTADPSSNGHAPPRFVTGTEHLTWARIARRARGLSVAVGGVIG